MYSGQWARTTDNSCEKSLIIFGVIDKSSIVFYREISDFRRLPRRNFPEIRRRTTCEHHESKISSTTSQQRIYILYYRPAYSAHLHCYIIPAHRLGT